MQLDGTIQTQCDPEKVVLLLLDPDALHKLAPVGLEIGKRNGDSLPFVIRRKVGPISLNLAGQLTLKARDGGHDLTLAAAHMVAGKVKISLALSAAQDVQGLHWDGMLESSGLTKRLIEERTERVRGIIFHLFEQLRDQAETA